ncbi:MAG: hypothetical protein ACK4Z4_11150, partial [Ferrovibrio sp.]
MKKRKIFRGGMPRRAKREKRAGGRGLAACVQAAGAADESESAGARDHDVVNMGRIDAAFNYPAALACTKTSLGASFIKIASGAHTGVAGLRVKTPYSINKRLPSCCSIHDPPATFIATARVKKTLNPSDRESGMP